jgi:hypothetical protein
MYMRKFHEVHIYHSTYRVNFGHEMFGHSCDGRLERFENSYGQTISGLPVYVLSAIVYTHTHTPTYTHISRPQSQVLNLSRIRDRMIPL